MGERQTKMGHQIRTDPEKHGQLIELLEEMGVNITVPGKSHRQFICVDFLKPEQIDRLNSSGFDRILEEGPLPHDSPA